MNRKELRSKTKKLKEYAKKLGFTVESIDFYIQADSLYVQGEDIPKIKGVNWKIDITLSVPLTEILKFDAILFRKIDVS